MREPRTKAGREMLRQMAEMTDATWVEWARRQVIAIEDEQLPILPKPGFAVLLEGTYLVTEDGALVEKPELEWRVGDDDAAEAEFLRPIR